MTHYCKYHPLEPAAWYCSRCRNDSCETCSPDQPGEAPGMPHYCLVCNGELTNLGAAHSALPFWQRFTSFLQYPFSPLGIGILLLGLLLPFVLEGMVLDLARAGFLLLVMKYGFTALEYAGSGRLSPVTPQELGESQNTSVAISLGVVLAVVAVGIAFLHGKQQFFFASLLAGVLVLLLPLMLMAAAIDRNAASATSPAQIRSTLAGVGPIYGVLALPLLLLLAGLQSFVSLFADVLPLHVSQALSLVVYGYFLLVLMVATGYVLFQLQGELNYTPAYGEKRPRKSTARKVNPAEVQVDVLLKEGMYTKAAGLLRSETNKKGATLTSHERYQKLMWSLGDDNALRQHAGPYLKLLTESNRGMQALSLMRSYLARDSQFRPEDPDTCLELAEAFVNMKEYKLAVHVLSGMHKESPHFVRLPEAYLLAARVLNENLGMPQKALALIQYLEGRFQTHKSFPEIQAYKGRMLAVKAG